MKSQMRLSAAAGSNGQCDHAARTDGHVANDLFVTFDPSDGAMTEAEQAKVRRWSNSWLPQHPGAVVVMGCNGKARNSASNTRNARLQALSSLLAQCGVPEDRIRCTDDVLDLQPRFCALPPDRGVLCLRVVRAAVLDTAVMPISHLFLSLTRAESHNESAAV